MSVMDHFKSLFDEWIKKGLWDYINLEAPYDETTFATADGGLCSFYALSGSHQIIGDQGLNRVLSDLDLTLKGLLARPGFRIHYLFVRDPDRADLVVDEIVDAMTETAERLQLDFSDMMKQKRLLLKKATTFETCIIAITTLPTALPPQTMKEESATRAENALKMGTKPAPHAQSPFTVYEGITDRHFGFVDNFTRILRTYLDIEPISTHDALLQLRREINPNTPAKWRPQLNGDPLKPRLNKETTSYSNLGSVMQPSIAYQLFNQSIEISENDPTILEIGERLFAPMFIDIPMQVEIPFNELLTSISDDLPWSMSFMFETGHDNIVAKVNSKKTLVSFIKFSGSINKAIHAGAEQLLDMAENEILLSANVSFATWANDLKTLKRRKAILSKNVESWGYCTVLEERGDPLALFVEMLPGCPLNAVSTAFPASIKELLAITPIARTASPWPEGSLILATPDRKIIPYEPASALQTFNIDLYIAPPGSGKSVSLAADTLAFILKPSNPSIPFVGYIDIGPSSAHFVKLLQNAAAPALADLFVTYRMQMTEDYATNVFDTLLGLRYPLSVDRNFVIAFTEILLTPSGVLTVSNLPEFASYMVDSMYRHFDDNPKMYEVGIDPVVDQCLDQYPVDRTVEVSWWALVDHFIAYGQYIEASSAQRYAVPTFADASLVISQDDSLKALFQTASANGEPLLDFVVRQLNFINRDFSLLSQPSVFDTGRARVVAFDLQDVVKSGSAYQEKQSGIMLMLCRYILAKDYFRSDETNDEIDTIIHKNSKVKKAIRHFHRQRIDEVRSVPKKLAIDEYHRSAVAPLFRKQIATDSVEIRKYNIHFAISSQFLDHFNQELIDVATNVYFLSRASTENAINEIIKKFNPGRDAMNALQSQVTRPGMMMRLSTLKNKNFQAIVSLPLSSYELWILATDQVDALLREIIIRVFGFKNGIAILTREFPSGSAKSKVQRQAKALAKKLEANNLNIYTYYAQEFARQYPKYVQ